MKDCPEAHNGTCLYQEDRERILDAVDRLNVTAAKLETAVEAYVKANVPERLTAVENRIHGHELAVGTVAAAAGLAAAIWTVAK